MIEEHYLEDVLRTLRKYRRLADAALAQVDDDDLLAAPAPETNAAAVVMKHVAGNMASRWTDFLTADGEKPWRERDREFELEAGDSAASIRRAWERGWDLCLATVAALGPEDLARTVRIRGEPHTVLEALDRQLTHYAYHVGQLVLLARLRAGPAWRSLSIPKDRSKEHEVGKDGAPYDPRA